MLFEIDAIRTGHTRYFLPTVEIKEYNVKIDGRNFFYQPINDDTKTYENIRKTATGQGDDYTAGCLLNYPYFKKYYKMIAIDLSKKQALDADPSAIQQINFTGNLYRAGTTTMFYIIQEAKKKLFLTFRKNCKSIVNVLYNHLVWFNIISICRAIKFTA